MLTSRITISSFLVAAMSVYACVLLSETPVRAQQAASVNKNQSAGLTDDERTLETLAQSNKLVPPSNRWPLENFVSRVLQMQERGELDLGSAFEILIEGDANAEGVLNNVEITQKSGDPALMQLAEELVTALSDSRVLTSLPEAKHLRLEIDSTKTGFAASASYNAVSKAQAMHTADAYNALFYGAALTKRGRDEELVYKDLHASSNGNEVAMTFSMPRETFCALLSKYLSSH
jgi:hypothetical protein